MVVVTLLEPAPDPTRSSADAAEDPIPEADHNGLEMLDRVSCLALLGSVPVGRLGMSQNALPVVLPVNFCLCSAPWDDEPVIVIRSGEGTKINAATERHIVAFEIDGFDTMTHSGWSVVVQGLTRVITAPDQLEWASSLPLRPWAHDAADAFVELSTDIVRGRRFGPQPARY